jgi:hypothetical protein
MEVTLAPQSKNSFHIHNMKGANNYPPVTGIYNIVNAQTNLS